MSSEQSPAMEVPFLDLKTPHRELWPEILPDLEAAFKDAAFIGGRHVDAFEAEFAAYCGAPHCATLNSGTDALHLTFRAMDIGPGDEVVTVAHTFIATAEGISLTGATPVFVDVDAATGTMDPALVEAAITPRTRAIAPVHLYGQCADMGPILDIAARRGIPVVEDAAQAHGATCDGRTAGTMGVAGAFSFYPGKNLGACGEAGAVVSADAALIGRIRQLRDHGQAKKYYHDFIGTNARMDALQAIFLRAKLRRLPGWNAARAAAAAYYDERIAEIPGVTPMTRAARSGHIYHLYVVLVDDRDAVQAALGRRGVGTGLHYPLPLHLQKAYAHLGHKPGDLPVTEALAARLLSLPMFPGLTRAQQDYVVDCLADAVSKR